MKQLKKIVAIAAVSAGIMGIGVASANSLNIHNNTNKASVVKIGNTCSSSVPLGQGVTQPHASKTLSATTIDLLFCHGTYPCVARVYMDSTCSNSGDTGLIVELSKDMTTKFDVPTSGADLDKYNTWLKNGYTFTGSGTNSVTMNQK